MLAQFSLVFWKKAMKNFVSIPVTDGAGFRPKPDIIKRWGAVPLLCWLAVVGMPLQRKLEVSQPVWTPDMFASTLAATSMGSSLQSIPFAVFMAAIYVGAGLMVMKKPKIALSILLRQWPLLLLLLFVATSMIWSDSKGKSLINLMNNLGVVLATLAAAMRYRGEPWLLPKHLAYVLGANVAVHLLSVILLPSFAIEWEGRWRGLTGQANELGGISFCAFWANVAVLIGRKNTSYRLHLFLAVCAAAAMLGANSMTSIISSLCALLITAVMAWNRSQYGGKRLFVSVLGTAILAAILGLLFLVNGINLDKLFGLAGRSGNFTGRTDIWMLAIDAIVASPWVGWGFDGNNYLIKISGMPFTSYHNGYLDLLVCGGGIGLGLFFLLLGNWFYQVRKRSRIGSDIAPFAIPFVASMLIYNLTEANLVAPRNHMWIIFLAILLLSVCKMRPQLPMNYSRKGYLAQTAPGRLLAPGYLAEVIDEKFC
jgi:exopolysaccharide production protein ExoQ